MSIVEVQRPAPEPAAVKADGDLRLAWATAAVAAVVCIASMIMLLTGLGA